MCPHPTLTCSGTEPSQSITEAVAKMGDEAEADAVACAKQLLGNAREGTRLLCACSPPGFSVRTLTDEDWVFLRSLADPVVSMAHANGAAPFTRERLEARKRADKWTASWLDSFKVPSAPIVSDH